jgi:hypothetical protein
MSNALATLPNSLPDFVKSINEVKHAVVSNNQELTQLIAAVVKSQKQEVDSSACPGTRLLLDRSSDIIRQLEAVTRMATTAQKSACERQIWELLREPRYANPRRLEHYAFKAFSQHGEDGMLQEIFSRIGTTNKRFVEFGVEDGLECNTHLLLYSGWNGLWIEGNASWAAKIRNVFVDPLSSGFLKLEECFITAENINDTISGAQLSGEIDILSIDIDGNDYHVCRAIAAVSPRVIVAEYNASFPPPIEWIKSYEPTYVWDRSMYFGASLAAYTAMLADKGFTLVGTDLCGANAFFVRSDLVRDRFAEVGDVAALYNPPRYSLAVGYPSGHPPSFARFAGSQEIK